MLGSQIAFFGNDADNNLTLLACKFSDVIKIKLLPPLPAIILHRDKSTLKSKQEAVLKGLGWN